VIDFFISLFLSIYLQVLTNSMLIGEITGVNHMFLLDQVRLICDTNI
jgi:hypothetical protein